MKHIRMLAFALISLALIGISWKLIMHYLAPVQKSDISEVHPAAWQNDIPPRRNYVFPERFIWGTATSAFQNDGGYGETDWDHWEEYTKHNLPLQYPGFNERDILMAQSMGIKSIRFSIEWAHVEPKKGAWNKKALEHYFWLASTMLKHGITPLPNLNHFTIPRWASLEGGWENREMPIWFEEYARHVAEAFRPLGIEFWMTFNEPTVILVNGYLKGTYPPLKKGDLTAAQKARRNLIEAHRRAYAELHRILDSNGKHIKVGIAHLTTYFEPSDPESDNDRNIVAIMDQMFNFDFMDAIRGRLDYVGINYYSRAVLKVSYFRALTLRLPVEWVAPYGGGPDINPRGLYELVKKFRVYRKPIIITENGIDDCADAKRIEFVAFHLAWLHRAVSEPENNEAPIIGYYHWTLFDNKEWARKEPACYGFVAVDLKSIDKFRMPRPSAYFFRDVIGANGITEEIIDKHLPKKEKPEEPTTQGP